MNECYIWYYGPNICASSKIQMLKLRAQCDGIGRWGLWEVFRVR